MMIILQLYAVFALATAIMAQLELIGPVLRKHSEETSKEIPNKYLLIGTFFIIDTLAAPFIFASCINPEWGIRFRESLQEALFSEYKQNT